MKTGAKKSLRLFYAMWPNDATRASLAAMQHGLSGRATRSENLHLTLVFLGDQPATSLPSLISTLARMRKTDIVLSLDTAGYFPRNKITWVGMSEIPNTLIEVQTDLVHSLEHDQIVFDRRDKFKPHVTLARETLPLASTFAPIRWHADRVALVQSSVDRDGVVYKVLATRQLNVD